MNHHYISFVWYPHTIGCMVAYMIIQTLNGTRYSHIPYILEVATGFVASLCVYFHVICFIYFTWLIIAFLNHLIDHSLYFCICVYVYSVPPCCWFAFTLYITYTRGIFTREMMIPEISISIHFSVLEPETTILHKDNISSPSLLTTQWGSIGDHS